MRRRLAFGAPRVALSLMAAALLALSAHGEAQTSGSLGTAVSHRPRRVLDVAVAPDPQPTAEGEPTGDAVTATIGSAGGVLASADGACEVTVPPGALASATELTLQPITNLAWGGIGTAYRLGPTETTFDLPVTVTFHLTDGSSPVSLEGLGIAEQDEQGYWRWTPGVERVLEEGVFSASGAATRDPWEPRRLAKDRMKVSGGTRRSGDKSAVRWLTLSPSWKLVELDECVELQIEVCYAVQSGASQEPIGGPCKMASRQMISANRWSVNGVEGGGSEFGQVVGGRSHGTYCAPTTRPKPASATVSVNVAAWEGKETNVDLRARFFINPPDLTGKFTIKMQMNPTSPAKVALDFEGHADLHFEKQNVLHDPSSSGTRRSYTMDGWLTLKTTSYGLTGFTCTNASAATQVFPQGGEDYFHIWLPEGGGSAQVFWVLEPLHWQFNCSPGGVSFVHSVSFGTLTGDGRCTEPKWVDTPDPLFPYGKFRETCNIGVIYDAEWSFEPQ